MLRDKNFIPLSHQHQRALALCVRIDRAAPIPDADLIAWQTEMTQLFQTEIAIHFAAEEQVLFPEARQFHELSPLVEELLAGHAALRNSFARAEDARMSATDLSAFAQQMSTHIRKEERQLFEHLQKLMTQEKLAQVGTDLKQALQDAAQVCVVPNEATKLKPAK